MDRAIVAQSHPITQPRKTKRNVCTVPLRASEATPAKMTAHTTAQPTLYAVSLLSDSLIPPSSLFSPLTHNPPADGAGLLDIDTERIRSELGGGVANGQSRSPPLTYHQAARHRWRLAQNMGPLSRRPKRPAGMARRMLYSVGARGGPGRGRTSSKTPSSIPAASAPMRRQR
jgi:hypothetical protein